MTDTPDNKAPEASPAPEKKAAKAKAPKTKKATDTPATAGAEASASAKATADMSTTGTEAKSEAHTQAPGEKPAKASKSPKAKKTQGESSAASTPSTESTVSTPAADGAAPVRKIETAKDLLSDDIGDLKIRRAKGSKNISSGICHILATFNNTLITFTDKAGNTIARSSSGKCGFKGAKKSTAYAAQVVCQDAAKAAMAHGLKEIEIRLSGPGMGRDSAVRAIQTLGLGVSSLIDVTPIPHNGCRARKHRRV